MPRGRWDVFLFIRNYGTGNYKVEVGCYCTKWPIDSAIVILIESYNYHLFTAMDHQLKSLLVVSHSMTTAERSNVFFMQHNIL